jgi:hypothetical protein
LWEAFAKRGVAAPAENDPVIIEFRERFAEFAIGYGVPHAQVDTMGKFFSPHGEPPVVFVPT